MMWDFDQLMREGAQKGKEMRKAIFNKTRKISGNDEKLYKIFWEAYSQGKVLLLPTVSSKDTFLKKSCIEDLKKFVKKRFLENELDYIMRAMKKNIDTLDICWSHNIFGIRKNDENTTYSFTGYVAGLSEEKNADWRDIARGLFK